MGVKLSSGTPPIVPRMPDIDFIRDIFLQLKFYNLELISAKVINYCELRVTKDVFFILIC